jgi:hypothetical protein
MVVDIPTLWGAQWGAAFHRDATRVIGKGSFEIAEMVVRKR